MEQETAAGPEKPRWAHEAKLRENDYLGGIELQFDADPHPVLQSKLRVLGFRPGKWRLMWYNPDRERVLPFVQQVVHVVAKDPEGPYLELAPTFEATQGNLEKKEFSFVQVFLKDGQTRSYVVFEPSKPRAEVLAHQFAYAEFGNHFSAVVVKPRLHLREARVLFNEGKIMLSTDEKTSVEDKPEPMDGQMIDTVQKAIKAGMFRPYSTIYKKLCKIIPGLLQNLQSGVESAVSHSEGFMDLHFDNLGKDADGNYTIALAHYYEQNGDLVPDPDMEIRIIPDMLCAEALTYQDSYRFDNVYAKGADGKTLVSPKNKKSLNSFLSQWLTNLANQGHVIRFDEEEKTVVPTQIENLGEHENHFPEFNPVVMARFLASEPVLLGEWEKHHQSDVLNGNTFTAEQLEHLKMFYSQLMDESHDNDEKYESLYESIPDKTFQQMKSTTSIYAKACQSLLQLAPGLWEQAESGVTDAECRSHTDAGKEYLVYIHLDSFTPQRAELFVEEYLGEKKQAKFDLLVDMRAQEARVTMDWMTGHYAGKYGRAETADEILDDGRLVEEALTEGFVEWAEDRLKQPQTVSFGLGRSAASATGPLKKPINTHRKHDPLTNEHGVFTHETAGENLQEIIIPFPTSCKYSASISLAKDSQGQYHYGISASKHFGDMSGHSSPVSLSGEVYNTKLGALEAALKEQFSLLEGYIERPDSILDNEPSKNHKLRQALKALSDLSASVGIPLEVSDLVKEEGKIPVKTIQLATEFEYENIYQIEFRNWKDANAWVKERVGKYSNVYSSILWQDGYSITSAMDLEPADFFQGKKDIYSQHLLDFYTRLSAVTNPITTGYTEDDVASARYLVNKYSFQDVALVYEITPSDILPVPGFHVDFGDMGTPGDRVQVTRKSYNAIGKSLQLADSELFLWKDKSWVLEQGDKEYWITEMTELTEQARQQLNPSVAKPTAQPQTAEGNKNSKAPIIKGLETAQKTLANNARTIGKVPLAEIRLSGPRITAPNSWNHVTVDSWEKADAWARKQAANLSSIHVQVVWKNKEMLTRQLEGKDLAAGVTTFVQNFLTTASNAKPGSEFTQEDVTLAKRMLETLELADSNADSNADRVLGSFSEGGQRTANAKEKTGQQFTTPGDIVAITDQLMTREQRNKSIENLVDYVMQSGEELTDAGKELLAAYTGSGGLAHKGVEGRGVLYEYYTPQQIVRIAWALAKHFGFAGGSVLEPSCGTGNFFRYAPEGSRLTGYETNIYAARIAQLLYPKAIIHQESFESIFFKGNIHLKDKPASDERYDLVIGNPPFGEFLGKYAGMGEKKWTGANYYEHYFLIRSLDLLKAGGLLVFILPSSFLSNYDKYNKVKEKISAKAELLDAYRLPDGIFEGTDIGTDIIVLRKK